MSFNLINPYILYTSPYDADAQAFINAAGLTSTTQMNAVNTLVLDLKAQSLWSKMYAVYPMVGGTATTHKFNLMNPADTDAAYRLSFSGTVTHSSGGTMPGANAAAITFLSGNTTFSKTDGHLSYYSRTNTKLEQIHYGVFLVLMVVLCHITQELFMMT